MSAAYINDAAKIYEESFRIIRAESNLARFPADIERVVVRMVHGAGDTGIADAIAFTPDAVRRGHEALLAGKPILCDSSMVAAGVIRSRLPANNDVICHLVDPALVDEARRLQTTKTAAAVERWRTQLDGAIVAIGNAPTALFRLLEVLRETDARPSVVLGIPVGFVGSPESKQALVDNDLGLEYLTVRGRRGGSAMCCAAINAIASRAETSNEPTR